MRRELFTLSMIVLAVSGCVSQPLVAPRAPELQQKLVTAAHWKTMADAIADKLVAELATIPDFDRSGYLMDTEPTVRSLIGRPIFVRSLDPSMPFSQAFNDLLTNQLMKRGYTVSRTPIGAVVVNYDVQLLTYRHAPPFSDGYVPGTHTLQTGAGYAVWQAVDTWDESSFKVGLVALGPIWDGLEVTTRWLTDVPNAEIIVTTSVVNEQRYLLRTADIFYVNEEDAYLYAHKFSARPALMPTGATVQVPARPVRISVVRE